MSAKAQGEDLQFLAEEAVYLEGRKKTQGHQNTRHEKRCLRGTKIDAPIKLQDNSLEGDLEASPDGFASSIPELEAEARKKGRPWTAMTLQYDLSLHKMWAHLGWRPRYGHMLEKMALFQQDRRAWTEQRPSSITWVGTRDFLGSSLGGCAPSRITADLNALSELGFVSKRRCGLNSGIVVEIDLDALYSAMATVGRWQKSDARSLHPPSKQSRPKPDIEKIEAKRNARFEAVQAKRDGVTQQAEEMANDGSAKPLFEQARTAVGQLATRLTNAQRGTLRNRPKYLESIKKKMLCDLDRCESEDMDMGDVLCAINHLREEVEEGDRAYINGGFIYDRAKGVERQRLRANRADKGRPESRPKQSNERRVGDSKDWGNTTPIATGPDEFEDLETGHEAMRRKKKSQKGHKPEHVGYGQPAVEERKPPVATIEKGSPEHEAALDKFEAMMKEGWAKP